MSELFFTDTVQLHLSRIGEVKIVAPSYCDTLEKIFHARIVINNSHVFAGEEIKPVIDALFECGFYTVEQLGIVQNKVIEFLKADLELTAKIQGSES